MILAAAACNTSQTGANGNLSFTPTNCGVIGGCDFADSIGVNGKINVQITGLDGTSTAGLDLASQDESVLLVSPGPDINNAPSWELTAVSPGVADLVALDPGGTQIDFVEVPVQEVTSFHAVPFAGSIVEGTPTTGYDQAFQVNADMLTSWYVVPYITGDVETMGRYDFTYQSGQPDITQYETATSDAAHGYFYVQLPAGGYSVTFNQVVDPGLSVAFTIDAVAP